jgi:LacI family transcriptional regulator
VAILNRIKIRGSHGVCIKARNTERIRDAINAICQSEIPVITLVTDLSNTDRIAYVGLDNIGAGETAAYLIEQTLGNKNKTIITTQSNEQFLGEAYRRSSFEAKLKSNTPKINIIKIKGGGGIDYPTKRLVYDAIKNLDCVDGVYSMGGGNRSILSALEELNLNPRIFIAHDLDKDNQALLLEKKITFVLNHDLKNDLKYVFFKFLSNIGLYPPQPNFIVSNIDVVTPMNIPKYK